MKDPGILPKFVSYLNKEPLTIIFTLEGQRELYEESNEGQWANEGKQLISSKS
jgi:hypothetical protein